MGTPEGNFLFDRGELEHDVDVTTDDLLAMLPESVTKHLFLLGDYVIRAVRINDGALAFTIAESPNMKLSEKITKAPDKNYGDGWWQELFFPFQHTPNEFIYANKGLQIAYFVIKAESLRYVFPGTKE